jgi:Recombinase
MLVLVLVSRFRDRNEWNKIKYWLVNSMPAKDRSRRNGNAKRGAGRIFNELYSGRIVWNKVRMLKEPDTGKRLSRPNSREEWQSIDVPQLRIVEQSAWEQAHALKTEKSHLASHLKRRAPHLLLASFDAFADPACRFTTVIRPESPGFAARQFARAVVVQIAGSFTCAISKGLC